LSGSGIPEYLVLFRKWDEEHEDAHEPVRHYKTVKEAVKDGKDERYVLDLPTWQKYASPVWFDIQRTDVLNAKAAKDGSDERHLCLAEGTLVLTKRGYIPIETILPGQDEVLTDSGAWHKVTALAKTRENADVVRVNAHGVPRLIATPDHKVMAKRGYGSHPKRKLCRIQSEWTAAKDLDECYVKAALPPEMESEIDAQEWWVIGRWLADGHIDSRGKQFLVSIGKSKWEEFQNLAKGHIGHVSYNEACGCYQAGLVELSDAARGVMKRCGRGAANKVLPAECISLNQELSEALYQGYMSGDGHKMEDGKETASSVSRALLLGMAMVAQKALGRVAAVYAGRGERDSEICGRKIHCKQEWNMVLSPKYSFSAIEPDGAWKKVKRVEDAGTADVWSIEVETDHSYMAEGCIVKNCPLQRETIRRAVRLFTNPDDIVYSPFGGIGSEPYIALEQGRRAIAVELKESYFEQMVANCKSISEEGEISLFD